MKTAKDLRLTLKEAMGLHQAGAVDRAIAIYRDVLAEDPLQADALHLLGAAHWQKGRLLEAEELIRRAISIWAKDPGYFSDLGGVLKSKGALADAIAEYKRALALDPRHRQAREGLADAAGRYGFELARECRWEEAEGAYRQCLELRPGDAGPLNNLGEIYQHGGNGKKALALYNEALALCPDYYVVRYNRAICQLGLGRLKEGWADLSGSVEGWLKLIDDRPGLPWLHLPLWNGSEPAGKRVLVWGDQGIGDEILFASMLSDLMARGAAVTVECTDRLLPLFARAFPNANFLARVSRPRSAPEFDLQAPGLWLGSRFRPNFESFPDRRGYLIADPEKRAVLRARYEAYGKSRIIGISWHSTSGGRAAARRMSLRELMGALPTADTLYVNLQYGDRRAEIAEAKATEPAFCFHHDADIDQLRDMDAFAGQIAACDHVVTIGNTTAHLAGALGVPAFVLLPIAGLTWYWFEAGLNSPWYPSLRMFRKVKEGDWNEPLQAVRLALEENLASVRFHEIKADGS